ncbi:MAG: hypothetical protein KDC45_09175, partial [Bacteroidetes bacterium]|nr:hypothetical protein [Bacteroidota bacterium]
FLMTVSIITLVVFLILSAFLVDVHEMLIAIGACFLALIHVLTGFYMTRWAINKSARLFMSVVMGGMGVRLLLIAVILVVLIRFLDIDIKLFILTFGIYYLLFQMVEIYFINRGLQLKKVSQS